MNIQIIYSSLTGCTQRLAQGIFDGITDHEKSIHNLEDGVPTLDGDLILLGYWVDKGGPNPEMKALMESLEGKIVGVFATLAYFVDTSHGVNSIMSGITAIKEKNVVLGSYVCNGALDPNLIEKFKKGRDNSSLTLSPEKELRWEMMKNHPTPCEIALGSERFNERIQLFAQFMEHDLDYNSLV